MTIQPLATIRRSLPLRVRGIEVNDPVLTIFGDQWSLNLMCPWVIKGPDFSVTWESDDIEDQAWELIGRDVESVTSSDDRATDPVFHFRGGIYLEVKADTDLDPWTLRLPGVVVNGSQPR